MSKYTVLLTVELNWTINQFLVCFSHRNLSNNKITEIEDGAFDGASSVVEFHLTANYLVSVRGGMFRGMDGLRMLQVSFSLSFLPQHF